MKHGTRDRDSFGRDRGVPDPGNRGDNMDTVSVDSYELAHSCGYAMFVIQEGEGLLARRRYFDDNSLSESYGQQVEKCPGCARELTDHV